MLCDEVSHLFYVVHANSDLYLWLSDKIYFCYCYCFYILYVVLLFYTYLTASAQLPHTGMPHPHSLLCLLYILYPFPHALISNLF